MSFFAVLSRAVDLGSLKQRTLSGPSGLVGCDTTGPRFRTQPNLLHPSRNSDLLQNFETPAPPINQPSPQ